MRNPAPDRYDAPMCGVTAFDSTSGGSGAPRGFTPASHVSGEIEVPGSKSYAQRVLAAAMLAEGTTAIEGLPDGADVLQAVRCARAGGARFPSPGKTDDLLATALLPRVGVGHVAGAPIGEAERAREWAEFPVGESGTAGRIFTALCALARPEGSGAEIVPSGSLARRKSVALFNALRAAGAGIEHASTLDGWPVLVTAAKPPRTLELVEPQSSQEVSALLMALAAHRESRDLRVSGSVPSTGYIAITRRVLEDFGAMVTVERFGSDVIAHSGVTYRVQGPLTAPRRPVRVEPDASSAAVCLAAAALSGGGSLSVSGLGVHSSQPDASITGALDAFGCDTSSSSHECLAISGEPDRGATIDCASMPDAAPVLAAVAAFAARRGHSSRLTGLGTLPGKESDRIAVLARGLSAIGLVIEHDDHSLSVAPARTAREPAERIILDPDGDHRMAFAFALLSLFEPGVHVSNPACVSKSWPGFWDGLANAGATLSA